MLWHMQCCEHGRRGMSGEKEGRHNSILRNYVYSKCSSTDAYACCTSTMKRSCTDKPSRHYEVTMHTGASCNPQMTGPNCKSSLSI